MSKDPKPVRHIPGTVETVDSATGKVVKREGMSWALVPPAPDKCQICAAKHGPEEPHNAQSLFYQMAFHGMHGRNPTWADALAHCALDVQAAWEAGLREKNAWTEPPPGEDPIAHHGVE